MNMIIFLHVESEFKLRCLGLGNSAHCKGLGLGNRHEDHKLSENPKLTTVMMAGVR